MAHCAAEHITPCQLQANPWPSQATPTSEPQALYKLQILPTKITRVGLQQDVWRFASCLCHHRISLCCSGLPPGSVARENSRWRWLCEPHAGLRGLRTRCALLVNNPSVPVTLQMQLSRALCRCYLRIRTRWTLHPHLCTTKRLTCHSLDSNSGTVRSCSTQNLHFCSQNVNLEYSSQS